MQSNLGRQVNRSTTKHMRHVLVHGIRRQPPGTEDQKALDDRNRRRTQRHRGERERSDKLTDLVKDRWILDILSRSRDDDAPEKKRRNVVVVVWVVQTEMRVEDRKQRIVLGKISRIRVS